MALTQNQARITHAWWADAVADTHNNPCDWPKDNGTAAVLAVDTSLEAVGPTINAAIPLNIRQVTTMAERTLLVVATMIARLPKADRDRILAKLREVPDA